MPLPPDCCEIIDVMENWGRSVSNLWFQEVLEYMMWNMEISHSPTRCILFYNCIRKRVYRMIGERFGGIQVVADAVMSAWVEWFFAEYIKEKSYFMLTVRSFNFVRSSMDEASTRIVDLTNDV